MSDRSFQENSLTSASGVPKSRWAFLFRSLLYISLTGLGAGFALGYWYIKGWISTAEDGLILYGAAVSIAAILSLSLVFYQYRLNVQKVDIERRFKKMFLNP